MSGASLIVHAARFRRKTFWGTPGAFPSMETSFSAVVFRSRLFVGMRYLRCGFDRDTARELALLFRETLLGGAPPEARELVQAGHVEKESDMDRKQHQNWLECIRSRKRPAADVEIGHRSATVCHLGNIAILTGRKLTWDPVKEEIVGDPEAARRVSRPYRAPWRLARG